ncbi:hypothetical protein [Rhizorhabdus dicambivorans]|uniref:Uncharacterized protein n=1 Tax=Rhizorhabdus dicambivorans TaxID=1850238 RepID=A0A2A4FYV3_9SPHN|nr:hypothetical protein [Rhizorhabdus dicambivorans]ATE64122.1 hypothetical protein CMV14_06735 [Rhizorhabdus dicambivorans]PCE42607.1 hypothetical protein COO09_09345 [Rhizorhabdus dicambivorans]
MARVVTVLVVAAVAGLFGFAVPLVRLFDAFQPIIVSLSIMIAAVFVRLNRGMPTLEWKSLEAGERKRLTAKIVQVTTEYGWIIGINATTLIALVTLSVVGKAEIILFWSSAVRHIASAAIGGLGALCVARMAYVVWRDIDIVRLQKRVIDDAATREDKDAQGQAAEGKVTEIRRANLRPIDVPPPKAWGD